MNHKEITLNELEEVTGAFRGIFRDKTFTTIEVGDYSIELENGRESTAKLVEQLTPIKRGSKIGLLRFNGALRVRICEEEGEIK